MIFNPTKQDISYENVLFMPIGIVFEVYKGNFDNSQSITYRYPNLSTVQSINSTAANNFIVPDQNLYITKFQSLSYSDNDFDNSILISGMNYYYTREYSTLRYNQSGLNLSRVAKLYPPSYMKQCSQFSLENFDAGGRTYTVNFQLTNITKSGTDIVINFNVSGSAEVTRVFVFVSYIPFYFPD